ncbi:unnamed protein product [Penicillium camemberti]|uniref:Str. FM013 n=1 Tax=Penicillium camemberti (strain FM 013) TaxID=1429867 RepID=A0A0G4PT77_PENC3|nr:unnamed protein product [Penicillium camemberti]
MILSPVVRLQTERLFVRSRSIHLPVHIAVPKSSPLEITQAYRFFGLGNRIGKIAISLENTNSLIPVSDTVPLNPFKHKS